MNPYSSFAFTSFDLSSFTDNDAASIPSAPAPSFNLAPLPTDQSEELHGNHLHQMDGSELCNPYSNLTHPEFVIVHDPMAHNPTLVQSGSLNTLENVNELLKDDQPNPPRLSIISSQNPDIECSICFSQFNNAFRCPKMLQCGHTFCLECLARMNVKSHEPSTLLCPLCRASTPLPNLGLPTLNTNSNVLSCLPSPMQRVYSVRFVRNKGRLQLKRSSGPLTSSMRRSLDVGQPSPVPGVAGGGNRGGVGEALFRLTGRPICRALLLTAVIAMVIALTGIIVLVLVIHKP